MTVLTADKGSMKIDRFSLKDTITTFLCDIQEKISLALSDENHDIEMLLYMLYMGKVKQSSPPRSN